MIEFEISDVDLIIKQLIYDMSPDQVSDQIPGLAAHLIFMCVRYCDHVNDDEKLQTLLTSAISAIGNITKVTHARSHRVMPYGVVSCRQF